MKCATDDKCRDKHDALIKSMILVRRNARSVLSENIGSINNRLQSILALTDGLVSGYEYAINDKFPSTIEQLRFAEKYPAGAIKAALRICVKRHGIWIGSSSSRSRNDPQS